MENEEHQQKRTEFESTLSELSDDEKTAKLTEWDQANPPKPKPEDEDYRGKLNAQNRFLEKEGYEFKEGKWVKKPATAPEAAAAPSDSVLTAADALLLAKSDVHQDDVQTILDWAKFKKVSVAEAMKDKDLKTVLDTHTEERRTAAATHTTGGSRGGAKISGEDLLAKAERTGEVPDTDEGMAALAEARQNRLRPKKS